jgi:hypothetical protein
MSRFKLSNSEMESPLPDKPSDFDRHSRSVTAGSICPILADVAKVRVNDVRRKVVKDSVLNLWKD